MKIRSLIKDGDLAGHTTSLGELEALEDTRKLYCSTGDWANAASRQNKAIGSKRSSILFLLCAEGL